jgi:hypothetical protein
MFSGKVKNMRACGCARVLQTLFSKRAEAEVQFLERTQRLGLLSFNAMLAAPGHIGANVGGITRHFTVHQRLSTLSVGRTGMYPAFGTFG